MPRSRFDSTERKPIPEGLLKNPAIAQALLEFAMVAIVVADGDGRIVLVNANTERLFGYRRDELLGQFIEILLPEHLRNAHATHRTDYLTRPRVRSMGLGLDLIGCRKDGTEFPAEIGLSPIETEGGTLILSFITDITERRRGEESLVKSEGRFRSLVEMTSDWVWEVDQNGVYTYASPKVRELLGYEPEEIVGKTPFDLMPSNEAERAARFFRDVVASRKPFTRFENTNRHKHGHLVVLETSGVPIFDGSGNLVGYRGIDRDITEHKRVTEQLRLQASALESAANGIIITDREGTILWVNPAYTNLTGYTPEEAIGQTPRLLKSEKHDPAFYQNLWDTIRSGQVWSGEIINRRKEGTLYTEEQTITPVLDDRGQISHFIAIKQDISERRRLEEEAKERQRLEDIIRFKSEFVANVSHELRTPLNSIIGFSELLLHSIPGPMNEKQAKYVNHILVSGQHLLALIMDILDLSKVEARKIELAPESLYLSDALEMTLTMVRPQASKKQILLTSEITPGPLTITADPLRFKQIMYNLLSNAVKFTPEEGQVHVAARLLQGSPNGDCVEIAVRDTGIGIRPDDQPKLFQEFSQVGGKHASRQYGTGLGLALSKKLVELHGGRIWVESAGEGKGCIFFFTLPINLPPPAET